MKARPYIVAARHETKPRTQWYRRGAFSKDIESAIDMADLRCLPIAGGLLYPDTPLWRARLGVGS